MVHSPYVLTIPSSTFTGSTSVTLNLGGIYRSVQSACYLSSDTVATSVPHLLVEKTEDVNFSQKQSPGSFPIELPLANHNFPFPAGLPNPSSPSEGIYYDPVLASFFRFVRITVTNSTAAMSAGTAYVVLRFDGSEFQ